MGFLDELFPFAGLGKTIAAKAIGFPRAAFGPEEEAAFKAMGFDPAEEIMPDVIDDWVDLYRAARAANTHIDPLVNATQSKVATGDKSTLSFRQRAEELSRSGGLIGILGSLGVGLVDAKNFTLQKVPFKKIFLGVAIGAGVLGVIFVLRGTTRLVSAVKE